MLVDQNHHLLLILLTAQHTNTFPAGSDSDLLQLHGLGDGLSLGFSQPGYSGVSVFKTLIRNAKLILFVLLLSGRGEAAALGSLLSMMRCSLLCFSSSGRCTLERNWLRFNQTPSTKDRK